MTQSLFTIGYGNWKDTKQRMDRLIWALSKAGINLLIDIRHSPCASDPGAVGNYTARPWNLQVQGGIQEELGRVKIDYLWLVELGNPQKRDPAMKVLKAHLKAGDEKWPMNRGLSMLARLVQDDSKRCSILCACGDYNTCHRRVIAETLSNRYFGGELAIIDVQYSCLVHQRDA